MRIGLRVFCLRAALALGTFLALHPLVAHATVYYVNCSNSSAGNGTSGTPWNSLSGPNAHTFSAGDQLLFASGTTCNGQLAPQGSGSNGNPIIINSYGSGNQPIINAGGTYSVVSAGGGNGNTYGAVSFTNQSYWEVNNLNITYPNSSRNVAVAGFYVVNNSGAFAHIYAQNLTVHDINAPVLQERNDCVYYCTGGIIYNLYGSSSATDILIANNTVTNAESEGIFVYGTNVTNDRIQYNTVSHPGADAIWVNGDSGGLLQHNTADHADSDGVPSGGVNSVWAYASTGTVFQYNQVSFTNGNNDACAFDADGGGSSGLVFQYNYSHDNWGGFFTFYGGTNTILRYNVSENDGPTNRALFQNAWNSRGAAIYNNDFYIGSGNSTAVLDGTVGSSTDDNNIIYNMGSGSSFTTDKTAAGGSWSNNIFYGNGFSNEPSDSNLLTSNPLFANPGNGPTGYELQSGSPAYSSGVALTNNGGQDYFGNAISNPPARGAYNGSPVSGGGGGGSGSNLLQNPTWASGLSGWTSYGSPTSAVTTPPNDLQFYNNNGAMNVAVGQLVTGLSAGSSFTASVQVYTGNNINGAYMLVQDGTWGTTLCSANLPSSTSAWTTFTCSGTVDSTGKLFFVVGSGNTSQGWADFQTASLTVGSSSQPSNRLQNPTWASGLSSWSGYGSPSSAITTPNSEVQMSNNGGALNVAVGQTVSGLPSGHSFTASVYGYVQNTNGAYLVVEDGVWSNTTLCSATLPATNSGFVQYSCTGTVDNTGTLFFVVGSGNDTSGSAAFQTASLIVN